MHQQKERVRSNVPSTLNPESKLFRKYSASQSSLSCRAIQNMISKKHPDPKWIEVCDLNFHDEKEYLQKYYGKHSYYELPELLEYYKYYSQDSLAFFGKGFEFLAIYHEKRKGIIYHKLKKQLNLSQSQSSLRLNLSKNKVENVQEYCGNILSEIQLTESRDESYCVQEVLKKLTSCFGPSRARTIEKLDHEYEFGERKPFAKMKTRPSEQLHQQLQQQLTQFTMVQKENNPSPKGSPVARLGKTHRKVESCPKNYDHSRDKDKDKDKDREHLEQRELRDCQDRRNNRIRRRKSAEIIATPYSNFGVNGLEKYKRQRQSLRNQQEKEKFYERMEEVRKKIRLEKENIYKVSQEKVFPMRKKLNKINK